jgi:hypothetical protein
MGELGQKPKNLGLLRAPASLSLKILIFFILITYNTSINPKFFGIFCTNSSFSMIFFPFPWTLTILQSPTNFVLKIRYFLSKLPIHPQYF